MRASYVLPSMQTELTTPDLVYDPPSCPRYSPCESASLVVRAADAQETLQPGRFGVEGGYSLPCFSTLGSQVHHSSWGTLSMTPGTCWPQPNQVVFSVVCVSALFTSRLWQMKLQKGRMRRKGWLTALVAGSLQAHGG